MDALERAGPLWIDLTRTVSRAGRDVPTGIDRVERAYLSRLLSRKSPDCRFLVRTTRGYLLLDRSGASKLSDILAGEGLPARGDLLSRLYGRGADPRHRVERALRDVAIDRCLPGGLGRMIARRAQGPFWYLNTGHSNLSEGTLGAFGDCEEARVAVLVHDLIPITHPDLVADGMPARFAGRIARVATHSDLVICNSATTRDELARHWQGETRRPEIMVAHLGLDPRPVGDGQLGATHQFVMLGTIEPRKNHALILDVWERLAETLPQDTMPDLHIIGPVGWKSERLMARLAAHPLRGKSIHVHGPLPEAEVRLQLDRATALLFPSLAEGFGYPPLEAMQAGALPICSDLPVFREVLGACAVYLDVTDTYSWVETIKKHVLGMEGLQRPSALDVPGWNAHFETVGGVLAHLRAEGP